MRTILQYSLSDTVFTDTISSYSPYAAVHYHHSLSIAARISLSAVEVNGRQNCRAVVC